MKILTTSELKPFSLDFDVKNCEFDEDGQMKKNIEVIDDANNLFFDVNFSAKATYKRTGGDGYYTPNIKERTGVSVDIWDWTIKDENGDEIDFDTLSIARFENELKSELEFEL